MMFSHNKNLNRHFQSCLLIVYVSFSPQHVSDADTGICSEDAPSGIHVCAFTDLNEAYFSLSRRE